MPQPYLRPIAEIDIVRQNQGGFRDDNFNSGWSLSGAGATSNTNGDVVTLATAAASLTFTKTLPAVSTATFTTVIARTISSTAGFTIQVNYADSTNDQFSISSALSQGVSSFTLTSGKTTSTIQILLGASATAKVDYVAIAKIAPLVLTTQDFETGVNTTSSTTAANEATFSLRNDGGKYTTGSQLLSLYDTVYCFKGYLQDDLITKKLSKTFGGTINELSPLLDLTGDTIQVQCLGWANALNQILVAQEYGSLSDNSSITTYPGIINDILNTYVNAAGTGYQLTTTYIQALTGPPAPTYLLFKNDDSFSAIKQICDLFTAGDPTANTVYPVEFFVDNSENAHLVTIGSWNTDPNPSIYPNALNVGREQITNNFGKNLNDMKNKIHFITAYINPPNRDDFTEGNAASWTKTITGSGGSTSGPSDDSSAGNFKVGSKSIKAGWTGRTGVLATVTYPSASNLGLDVTKIGGKITPPTLRVYVKSDTPNGGFGVFIIFYTDGTDYFGSSSFPLGNDSSGKPSAYNDTAWHLIETYFGPYGDGYTAVGSPNWNNITQIGIQFVWFTPPTTADIWVDGAYLEGQNHYVATDSTRISGYGQRETTISSLKHRDASTEKKLAKAELFRLHNPVMRGSVQIPGIPDVLPGQMVTITAPSANLSATNLRVLQVKQSYTPAGFLTTLDLTDDVTNYQALRLTSMADLLLMQYVPKRISQREKDETTGQPLTLSGMQDPTTVAQTQDYPS